MGQAAPFETTPPSVGRDAPHNAEIYTASILRDLASSAGPNPNMIAAMAMSAMAAAQILLARAGIEQEDLDGIYDRVWGPIVERAQLD